MRQLTIVFVAGLIAIALTVGAVKADPPQAVVTSAPVAMGTVAPAPNPQFYNGYWWYRMPDGRWLYYMNGQWVGPPAQAVYAYPSYAAAPALLLPVFLRVRLPLCRRRGLHRRRVGRRLAWRWLAPLVV